MAKSFHDMVAEAQAEVAGITPTEAHQRLREDEHALLIEVRDADMVPEYEKAPNVVMISLGTLPLRADLEVPEETRDPRLQDRSRPVITTCRLGKMAALGAQVLKDMGFTNVAYMEGGMQAWREAGLPTLE